VGILRPDIVLFGEPHINGDEIGGIIHRDTEKKPDLLLVMGTSLSVYSVKDAVRSIAKAVRRGGGLVILVNKTEVSAPSMWRKVFDFHIKNEADEWVKETVSHWIRIAPSEWDEGPNFPSQLLKHHSLLAEPVVHFPE
jgi:NAD-dependent histone deacetylase SIR2